MQKKLSRDRADYDRKFGSHFDFMNRLENAVSVQDENTQCVAGIVATLVENLNMQMEAETADLIDRRMMQLFAVAHKKFEKIDV